MYPSLPVSVIGFDDIGFVEREVNTFSTATDALS